MLRRTLAALAVLPLLVLALPRTAGAAASAWAENPESRVRLVTPYRVAPREGEVWLGLQFTLSPGWHVYWKNSGDAGLPPALDLSATPELSAVRLRWPAPERYELPGGLVAFGYGEEVVYPVQARIRARIEAPRSEDRDRVTISARVDYLVCEVDCVPHGYDLAFEQPVGAEAEPDPEAARLVARWRERVPVAPAEVPGVSSRARLDLADPKHPVLAVDVEGVRAAGSEPTELFLEVHDLFEPGRPRLEPHAGGLGFRVPMSLKRKLAGPLAATRFDWTVTGLEAAGSAPDAAAGKVFALEARADVPVARGEARPAARPKELARAWNRSLERPPVLAVAAVLALLVALRLWGLLGGPRRAAPPAPAWRQGLGFLAAAALFGLLYRLADRVDPVRLALAELALLVTALAGWLTARARRPGARWLAWAVLAAAGAAAVWLAAVG